MTLPAERIVVGADRRARRQRAGRHLAAVRSGRRRPRRCRRTPSSRPHRRSRRRFRSHGRLERVRGHPVRQPRRSVLDDRARRRSRASRAGEARRIGERCRSRRADRALPLAAPDGIARRHRRRDRRRHVGTALCGVRHRPAEVRAGQGAGLPLLLHVALTRAQRQAALRCTAWSCRSSSITPTRFRS